MGGPRPGMPGMGGPGGPGPGMLPRPGMAQARPGMPQGGPGMPGAMGGPPGMAGNGAPGDDKKDGQDANGKDGPPNGTVLTALPCLFLPVSLPSFRFVSFLCSFLFENLPLLNFRPKILVKVSFQKPTELKKPKTNRKSKSRIDELNKRTPQA